VALRSLYTFVLVFLFLKITGRRGVRQMSLFEVLIILTLGSAAGMSPFMTMCRWCRSWWFLSRWRCCTACDVADVEKRKAGRSAGREAWSSSKKGWPGRNCKANMTEFEFFMELRLNSVEQLGQVRLAIMETNGQISVYYYLMTR
jgi:uncharacterized membrane protein YcaP (DUF421 family)